MHSSAGPRISRCRYSVQWPPSDGEFVARVAEFSSLSGLDKNQFEALRGLEELVEDVVRDLESNGEEVLVPFAEHS